MVTRPPGRLKLAEQPAEEPATEGLSVPLPTFRQPPDPEPPATPTPEPPSPSGPAGDEPERPSPMPDPYFRTGTSTASTKRRGGAGDPLQVARMLAGLLAMAAGATAAVLYRRGRQLRQPTPGQLDDISRPLGRLLVRLLPLEVIDASLVDVTEAAAATHAYVLDGPLVEPVAAAPIPLDDPEEPA
jgi:hypothetical protein